MMYLSHKILVLMTVLALSTLSFATYALEVKNANPIFVRTITSPYEQYNDVHPTWSTNGDIISFERYDTSKHEIILSDLNGNKLQTISILGESQFNLDDILGDTSHHISYNSGISWAPNNSKFVFTSNGRYNNFDLYIGKYGQLQNKRLTFHHQKDSHASWSPDGRYICFISSRNGHAQLYRYDTHSGEIINLLNNEMNAFYPAWSPDSKKIAFMLEIEDTYQIYVIDNIDTPEQSLRAVTQLSTTSIRPSWSKDGQKLAFYHQSKMSEEETLWDIVIVDANSKQPISDSDANENKVAENVIMNSETGPTWIQNKNYIAYVKNENDKYNPIHLVNTQSKEAILLNTNTMLNKDLSCSDNGLLAFQTQDRQWSRIFIAMLPELKG